MSLHYKYSVDDSVLVVFLSIKRQQREKLLRSFNELSANPFMEGNSLQRDHVGRYLQVRRFGEWTITYWPDHLAKQLHIVAVEHLRM